MDSDDLVMLMHVMSLNNGVLRPRDHPNSRATLARLVRSGAIVKVLPGTYVDADRCTERRTRYAAALAFAPGSVLWGSDARQALTSTLDATAFGSRERVTLALAHSRHPADGVRWVRRRVPGDHRVRIDGLRCPSASFVAVEASARDEGELIEQFLRERRMNVDSLAAALKALAGTPGQDVRRRVVRCGMDNPWSGGERQLQALLRARRVAGWIANSELIIEGKTYYPDLLWPDERVIVEFDGYQVHTRRDVFETDRSRQNALMLAGYLVLRITWTQLTEAPDEVARLIRQALKVGAALSHA